MSQTILTKFEEYSKFKNSTISDSLDHPVTLALLYKTLPFKADPVITLVLLGSQTVIELNMWE